LTDGIKCWCGQFFFLLDARTTQTWSGLSPVVFNLRKKSRERHGGEGRRGDHPWGSTRGVSRARPRPAGASSAGRVPQAAPGRAQQGTSPRPLAAQAAHGRLLLGLRVQGGARGRGPLGSSRRGHEQGKSCLEMPRTTVWAVTLGKPLAAAPAASCAQGIYEGHTAMAEERDGRRTRGEGEEEGSVRTW
jgi:hypothetical protein